ncbi:RNA-binding S4 domain-containing protein [Flavimaricola marinus]|uniref:Heat shock protein 15 n=1 Tax=Flavimaricola marinus TaxID=1819565 RepID=A0A238LGG1_9RHOB|nr:RNA-binding S4 domain-containing protein [Flavimaricola marinus]SMY08688.1 Heat shock protein 15 [Flavimaricola marinus]
MTEAVRETIRLDKWLWQARFFKTRSLAAGIVSASKVRVNGTPVSKPARAVGAGDVLTFPKDERIRVVRILGCGTRRGPAPEAQGLYDDMSDPAPAKQAANPKYDGGGRPTGRDRRRADAVRRQNDPSALE